MGGNQLVTESQSPLVVQAGLDRQRLLSQRRRSLPSNRVMGRTTIEGSILLTHLFTAQVNVLLWRWKIKEQKVYVFVQQRVFNTNER